LGRHLAEQQVGSLIQADADNLRFRERGAVSKLQLTQGGDQFVIEVELCLATDATDIQQGRDRLRGLHSGNHADGSGVGRPEFAEIRLVRGEGMSLPARLGC
jgi:hypothetical protein